MPGGPGACRPAGPVPTLQPVFPHRDPPGRARALCAAGLLLALAGAGCRSYPERTAAALGKFTAGRFEEAAAEFADTKTTGSEFLSGAEAGMADLAAGNWEPALEQLHRAGAEVREIEERALASPEKLGQGLLTWIVNEGAKRYEGEGYERVMLHASLALCYLALGRVDDVYVEARLANRLLEAEESLYEKKYAAGGLGHFVSAVTYELIGRPDDAYVDYRRMVEKGVGVELAGAALVRLAARLGYQDDLDAWQERFGEHPAPDPDAASIVVIAGVGLGPAKFERGLVIPWKDGVFKWAVPRFQVRPQPVDRVRLILRSHDRVVATTVVESVSQVAYENLEDRIAWLAAKSAVRSIMKYELTRQLTEDHGGWGFLAGLLIATTTERADLRSWQTLPDSWQAARVFVPPGEVDLALEAAGGDRVRLGRFGLEAGETMFVLARTLDRRIYAHAIGGILLDESPAGEDNRDTQGARP